MVGPSWDEHLSVAACLEYDLTVLLRTSRPAIMKVREVIRRLLNDGWVQVAQKGSHRQFKHPSKPGKVTVPGKPSDDLPEGTYRSILRQAGLQE